MAYRKNIPLLIHKGQINRNILGPETHFEEACENGLIDPSWLSASSMYSNGSSAVVAMWD